MSVNLMFFVLLLVVCALAGWIAIPRIMRSWTVATKPTDERLEYVSHMGKEMDCGPSEVASAEHEHAAHRDLEGTPIRQL